MLRRMSRIGKSWGINHCPKSKYSEAGHLLSIPYIDYLKDFHILKEDLLFKTALLWRLCWHEE